MKYSEDILLMIADKLKIISEPVRLKLLWLLVEKEMCVGDMVAALGCTQANVSKHLNILSNAGFLDTRKEGQKRYYKLTDKSICNICSTVVKTINRQIDKQKKLLSKQ